MTPESKLKKEVTGYLDGARIFYRRMNTGVIRKGSRFIHLCPEGTADLMVCKFWRPYVWVLWIELKDPNGSTAKKRQMAQAAFRDEVVSLGHRYAICESLDEVIAFLNS